MFKKIKEWWLAQGWQPGGWLKNDEFNRSVAGQLSTGYSLSQSEDGTVRLHTHDGTADGHIGTMSVDGPIYHYMNLDSGLKARQIEWVKGGQPLDAAFLAIEFAGEVGELMNVIKKIYREKQGWRGSRATREDLEDEFGDVMICLHNLAHSHNIDLDKVSRAKFNKTSIKYGFPMRVAER